MHTHTQALAQALPVMAGLRLPCVSDPDFIDSCMSYVVTRMGVDADTVRGLCEHAACDLVHKHVTGSSRWLRHLVTCTGVDPDVVRHI